jgi:NitT/TauT family transport system substrate-binding protein
MRAIIKAYDFFQSNKEITLDHIAKYIQLDRRVLDIETYGSFINDNPDPNSNAIRHFWDAIREIGYIESDINIDDHIDTTPFTSALDSLLAENPGNANYQALKADFANLNS